MKKNFVSFLALFFLGTFSLICSQEKLTRAHPFLKETVENSYGDDGVPPVLRKIVDILPSFVVFDQNKVNKITQNQLGLYTFVAEFCLRDELKNYVPFFKKVSPGSSLAQAFDHLREGICAFYLADNYERAREAFKAAYGPFQVPDDTPCSIGEVLSVKRSKEGVLQGSFLYALRQEILVCAANPEWRNDAVGLIRKGLELHRDEPSLRGYCLIFLGNLVKTGKCKPALDYINSDRALKKEVYEQESFHNVRKKTIEVFATVEKTPNKPYKKRMLTFEWAEKFSESRASLVAFQFSTLFLPKAEEVSERIDEIEKDKLGWVKKALNVLAGLQSFIIIPHIFYTSPRSRCDDCKLSGDVSLFCENDDWFSELCAFSQGLENLYENSFDEALEKFNKAYEPRIVPFEDRWLVPIRFSSASVGKAMALLLKNDISACSQHLESAIECHRFEDGLITELLMALQKDVKQIEKEEIKKKKKEQHASAAKNVKGRKKTKKASKAKKNRLKTKNSIQEGPRFFMDKISNYVKLKPLKESSDEECYGWNALRREYLELPVECDRTDYTSRAGVIWRF